MSSCPSLFVLLLTVVVPAATAADAAFFESKIRPVLVHHCYECHSAEAGKAKGGLELDSKEATLLGGDTGPAIVPGDSAKSLLLTAISHADPDLEMPPKKAKLPEAVIKDFQTWIEGGAIDPRTSATPSAERAPVSMNIARGFWSYQQLRMPTLPKGSGTAIDAFIQAKLAEHQLAPAPEATPVVLLRRLYFDLIGLPPTPEDVAAFLADAPATRVEKQVERLLKSPRFGERWGRHWLDVVRYAESNGREANLAFPHAWRYRDYVIDAINTDVPYDRFITEQLAGDLLPAKDEAERARLLIATGFLAIGPKGLGESNKQQFAADVADEQLDAVTRAVMASSIACARCHDHKTDPFSMEDYYALAGIFKSTETFFGNWIDSENNNDGDLIPLPRLPGQVIPNRSIGADRVKKLKADLERMDQEEKAEKEMARRAKAEGKKLEIDYYEALKKAIGRYWTRGGIEGELERVDELGQALPLCMGVKDAQRMVDSPLYVRGELAHPGKLVPRGFPKVFALNVRVPLHESGRLQLAQWLTDRKHPLTARVMVNRIWRHLFGAGLVRTVDNFGFTGEPPSHPTLLDYLAIKFMDNGWSIKALIREIVLSQTYRQDSAYRADAFANDPENRLIWRAAKRRLDAEVIRDSMLAVSGLLDTSRRRASLVAELEGQSMSLIGFNPKVPSDLDDSVHRSVYLPVIRDHLPDVLEQFDVANPNLVTGDRDITNVPLQALYLLNGPFVHKQASALAAKLMQQKGTHAERIQQAFVLCFNRLPMPEEKPFLENFIPDSTGEDAERLVAFCQALMASAEFRIID